MLNSKNSDFSPSFGNSDYNEIYFTSSREGGLSEDIDERTGENYTDIYVSKLQKSGKWSAPALLPSPINSGNAHEGSSNLNSRGNRIYFTKCSAEDKKINNSIAASDAFFPFTDGISSLIKAGVKTIIQPGGSIKDDEVIKAAEEKNLTMTFTGVRHFKH